MNTLKLDKTRLKTFSNYAKMIGVSVPRVYQLEKEDKISVEKIDGVKFVDIVKTQSK